MGTGKGGGCERRRIEWVRMKPPTRVSEDICKGRHMQTSIKKNFVVYNLDFRRINLHDKTY